MIPCSERRCRARSCITRLNSYNPGPYCLMHSYVALLAVDFKALEPRDFVARALL